MKTNNFYYRILRIKIPEQEREIIKEFIDEWRKRVFLYLNGEKKMKDNYLYCYVDACAKDLMEALKRHNRFKRTWPIFRMAFFLNRKKIYGSSNAPIRIDIDRRSLKFRWLKKSVQLNKSTIDEIKNVLKKGNIRSVGQLTLKDGVIFKVIFFKPFQRKLLKPPFEVIAIDINSMHGVKILNIRVDFQKIKLIYQKRLKPPNHSNIWREIRKRQKLYSITFNKIYAKEIKQLGRRRKGLNKNFINNVIHILRKLVRKNDLPKVILVDPIDYKSLQGKRLQSTLLSIIDKIRNLAGFEDTLYVEYHGTSGRRCPLCNRAMKRIENNSPARIYRCERCRITIERDVNACWRMILKFLYAPLKFPVYSKIEQLYRFHEP